MILNLIVAKFNKFDKFSAFMLWSTENRQKVQMEMQKENPKVHNDEISQMLGVLWKHQVPAETKKYRLKFKILLIFNVRFKF